MTKLNSGDMKTLIVDDQITNRCDLEKLLKGMEFVHIDQAPDVEKAIQKICDPLIFRQYFELPGIFQSRLVFLLLGMEKSQVIESLGRFRHGAPPSAWAAWPSLSPTP